MWGIENEEPEARELVAADDGDCVEPESLEEELMAAVGWNPSYGQDPLSRDSSYGARWPEQEEVAAGIVESKGHLDTTGAARKSLRRRQGLDSRNDLRNKGLDC